MVKNVRCKSLFDSCEHIVHYIPATECPRCKTSLIPEYLYSLIYKKDDDLLFASIEYCSRCNNIFISTYLLSNDPKGETQYITPFSFDDLFANSLISSEPNQHKEQSFNDEISNLSPQFVKIYNQSLAAEAYNLDEIAGIGYRKALEFLIKDFAIHEYSDEVENIKSMNLSLCIKEYISDPNIKNLAERSTWLGNDEAHYIRKQGSYDISDMKQFIQAIVYFINMVLITDKASNINPVR